MSLQEMLNDAEARPLLLSVDAENFLKGTLRTEQETQGYVRPWRMSDRQYRSLGSVGAWHPGFYRQMAQCTCGIALAFTTDATRIGLEVRFDEEPLATRTMLRETDGESPQPPDGISCIVDGKRLVCAPAQAGEQFVEWYIDNDPKHPTWQRLPGFGPTHTVWLWLPCLRGCAVRRLWGTATFFKPLKQQDLLLVVGDEASQGFGGEEPADGWPVAYATHNHLDLVNQSIARQVFQSDFLLDTAGLRDPAMIVVAVGEQYRKEAYSTERLRQDGRQFFGVVQRRWPDAQTLLIVPHTAGNENYPVAPRSPFPKLETIYHSVAREFGVRCIEGRQLVDPHVGVQQGTEGYPNAEGFSQIARRLALVVQPREDQAVLRQRAKKLLRQVPDYAFPLKAATKIERAQWLFVKKGACLVKFSSGLQMLYAPDHEQGQDVAALFSNRRALAVQGEAMKEWVSTELGLTHAQPYHVAIYKGKRKISVPERYHIETLPAATLDELLKRYPNMDTSTVDDLDTQNEAGTFFGGFVCDKLVGFIGTHEEGCIGSLEVMPAYRRRGWAVALEATLVNHLIDKGIEPWCPVYPESTATLRLLSKLGFEITPATQECYLCTRD